ncbi:MAG: alpha amylase C-terminal domain-containing protein [Elusimicrobia bacterium]|nr:alpha amylase C-terminal domain-containing protein [Elusimicrobiota bacterium]
MSNWLYEAIIYEIFPRIFTEEGSFQGIIDRLPELKDLGINTLWLMPIHKIGRQHRKGTLGSPYAVCDYLSTHPDLGSKDDFRRLVNSVHRQNMRIIIDCVVMYTAWDHPWIKKHPDWYRKNEKGEIVSPNSDWIDVAHLNYANLELHEEIIKIMKYWIKEFDIDGYRCDTAGNMYGYKPVPFWQKAIAELRTIKQDVLMLAEWEDPEFHKDAFDLTYSWALYHLLRKVKNNEDNLAGLTSVDGIRIPWTEKEYSINPKIAGAGFIYEFLKAQKEEFPEGALKMRIIENHDEPRAANPFGKEESKAYAVLIFTLDGIPLLYNGQEIGETERPSHFEPYKIDWKNGNFAMKDFYKKLIAIRKTNPALRIGDLEKIQTGNESMICGFVRKYKNDSVVVLINFSSKNADADIIFPDQGEWADILNENSIKIDNTKKCSLQFKPHSSHIFKRK